MKKTFQRNAVKYWSCFITVLLLLVFTACGGSDDEPEKPNENPDSVPAKMISASVLPGTWVIESVTSVTGQVTPINQEFTILPFQVNQKNVLGEVNKNSDGSEDWTEIYFSNVSVETNAGTSGNDMMVTYYRKKGQSVGNSYVAQFGTNFPNYDQTGLHGLILTDLEYHDGVIIAGNGGFNYEANVYNEDDYSLFGTVKLRKK